MWRNLSKLCHLYFFFYFGKWCSVFGMFFEVGGEV